MDALSPGHAGGARPCRRTDSHPRRRSRSYVDSFSYVDAISYPFSYVDAISYPDLDADRRCRHRGGCRSRPRHQAGR